MKLARYGLRVCLLSALAMVVACTQQQPAAPPPPPDTRAADEAAIRAASADWFKAAAARDVEKTLSYYADDASMFPPNAPIANSADARRKVWTEMLAPADLVLTGNTTKVEVARSGDIAYETGTVEESSKDKKGKLVKFVGKYVVVWKKQPNGQWKAQCDIFNADQ